MNPAVTEGEVRGTKGPGGQLKVLREAQDLDISRVATLLHLSEDKLEALEADNYEQLPSPVFIQGYFRNYARFLGVPVEPILDAYHALSPEKGRLPDLKITQVSHEVGSSHVLVRLITWLIVIGLLALVVVWWRGYLKWPVQLSMPIGDQLREQLQEVVPEQQATDYPDTLMLPEFNQDGQATLLLPQAEQPEAEIEQQQPGQNAPDGPLDETDQGSDAGRESVLPLSSPEPATSPVAAESAAPAAANEALPGEPGVVEVQFDGTSWVKITDSGGSFKMIGEVKSGTRRALEGTPPYNLVLGKAEAVRLFVHGKQFDITPYTRGNVARFTLDPQRVER